MISRYKEDNQFVFDRFDGIFNIKGEWEVATILAEHQPQLDNSFNLFATRLQALLKLETGLSLDPRDKKEEIILDFEIGDSYIKSDLLSSFKNLTSKDLYLYQGRLPFEAFSLDGVVYVFSKVKLKIGSIIRVNLDKFLPPYDFVCVV